MNAPPVCAHPDCFLPVTGRDLACRTHWYQLPTSLRNRINLAHRQIVSMAGRGGKRTYALAWREAFAVWETTTPDRCRCGATADGVEVLDGGTERPTCLECLTAGSVVDAPPRPCTGCGRLVNILTSDDSTPPHLCLGCATRMIHNARP